jgi:hypothetical protein
VVEVAVADLVLQLLMDFSGEVLPVVDLVEVEVVLEEAQAVEAADLEVLVAEALVVVVLAEVGNQLEFQIDYQINTIILFESIPKNFSN